MESPSGGRKSNEPPTRWRRRHNSRRQEEPESVETSSFYKAYQGTRWYYQRCQSENKRINPAEVKGNLRRNLEFWIHTGAPKFILSVIANGYCLPFQCTPVGISLNN